MKRRTSGFTLIELLVVIAIIATLAGLVSLLLPRALRKQDELVCKDHVRNLTGLLESTDSARYPQHSGPNLILFLTVKGQIAGRDALQKLFCPGDLRESFADAGGVEAYVSIDLSMEGEYGHLTSYAARDQRDPAKRARRGAMPPVVLLADDSEDHHHGRGIVVGLTGGAAKWRDKVEDYGLKAGDRLVVGDDSPVEELAALKTD